MVVDTMVVAYALLGVPEFRDESLTALASLSDIHVPDSFRAELANVVWQWIIHRGTPRRAGQAVLRRANALIDHHHRSDGLWERALELAVQARHPVYDTLFVALAEHLRCEVLTYDRKLLAAFPEATVTPGGL